MEKSDFIIEEELKKLPSKPGVYMMRNEADRIIYVGKAISLKNRVRQYFQSSRNKGAKIERMVTHIKRFEYIVTDSELEALVLECNLIKEHHPKYNTMLMDDKSYPFIKVTINEDFPRIMLARTRGRDKAKYFGPYTSSTAVKDTIDLVRKLYNIRSCNRNLPKDTGKERPCLNYHIHQCDAPCQAYITKEDYGQNVQKVISFLSGNFDPVIKELKGKMEAQAEALEFEKAMEYRELMNSVVKISQKQKITNTDMSDRDIIAVALEGHESGDGVELTQKELALEISDTQGKDAIIQIFFIRGGRLIGRDHFYLKVAPGDTQSDVLQIFIQQFYGGTPYLPSELMVQHEIQDVEILQQWLSEKKGTKVQIKVPKIGSKEKLVELAAKNARLILGTDKERLKREMARTTGALKEIGDLIGLDKLERIEAYDISNISGFSSVGSMIVYEKGKPKKNDYRKFRIKGVEGADDYASMCEVLTRRFKHGLNELKEQVPEGSTSHVPPSKKLQSFSNFPDLIMMDGGKGQVNIALKVLGDMKLNIPVCGMVKDDNHRTRGLFYDNIELPIERNSEGFKLITRVQDEAHRFAIEFHRSLRSKGQVHSILDDIKGVGPARRKSLMMHFTSIDAIKAATVEELAAIPSMDQKSATMVYEFFH